MNVSVALTMRCIRGGLEVDAQRDDFSNGMTHALATFVILLFAMAYLPTMWLGDYLSR